MSALCLCAALASGVGAGHVELNDLPSYAQASLRAFAGRPHNGGVGAKEQRAEFPAADPMKRILFSDEATHFFGARCLDGSSSGYYYRPGTGKDASSFAIFLEGGGLCVEPIDCLERAKARDSAHPLTYLLGEVDLPARRGGHTGSARWASVF